MRLPHRNLPQRHRHLPHRHLRLWRVPFGMVLGLLSWLSVTTMWAMQNAVYKRYQRLLSSEESNSLKSLSLLHERESPNLSSQMEVEKQSPTASDNHANEFPHHANDVPHYDNSSSLKLNDKSQPGSSTMQYWHRPPEPALRGGEERPRSDLFPGGIPGIADPSSLRRHVEKFKEEYAKNQNVFYFTLLEQYKTDYATSTESLQRSKVCSWRRNEGPGGYELLTRKVEVHNDSYQRPPKLFCAMYTYGGHRNNARVSALSWGVRCDGFVAFSNETIPSLGQVSLPHAGVESWKNMWQKVRSIWAYIAKYYMADYDYFHIGGDDMYLIVENLKNLLREKEKSLNAGDPLFLGAWGPKHRFSDMRQDLPLVRGGPGYTLNREALRLFVSKALPTCERTRRASFEDCLMTYCFSKIGVYLSDSRDSATAEQLYHGYQPERVYSAEPDATSKKYANRLVAYWATLPHPSLNQTVGPKSRLEAAGRYSVSFHRFIPESMARAHALLYKECSFSDYSM